MPPKQSSLPKVGGSKTNQSAPKASTAKPKQAEKTSLPAISKSPDKAGGNAASPVAPVAESTEATTSAVADATAQVATEAAAAKEEEERINKANAEAAAAAAAAAAKEEADRLEALRLAQEEEERRIKGNGNVILIYEQYNESFPIVDGKTTAENIDEVYCLSFVMPNCLIHLSRASPPEKRQLDEAGNIDYFIKEDPRGTYLGLEKDTTYYVYVEQEEAQLKRDQERMRRVAAEMEGAPSKDKDNLITKKDDGRGFESCSCSEGAPCVDEYGCKDWANRFAIASKNGWKGF